MFWGSLDRVDLPQGRGRIPKLLETHEYYPAKQRCRNLASPKVGGPALFLFYCVIGLFLIYKRFCVRILPTTRFCKYYAPLLSSRMLCTKRRRLQEHTLAAQVGVQVCLHVFLLGFILQYKRIFRVQNRRIQKWSPS